jgi:ABC-type sugar transport system permease subunit
MKRLSYRLIALFVGPAFFVYVLLYLAPSLAAFGLSLTDFDGISRPVWVGLDNYRELFKLQGIFFNALLHNLFLIFVPGVFLLAISLLFAYWIDQGLKGAMWYRVLFFFPNIMPTAATSILWLLIFSVTDMGLVNALLTHLGVEPVAFWESSRVLWTLVPVIVWSGVGFFMILFLAAMSSIPDTLYEAARIDGAGLWSQFIHVTLPLLQDTIATCWIFIIIGGLKAFDLVWIVEKEVPTGASHTMATLMYSEAFRQFRIGYGTAMSVILFLIILSVTLISMRTYRKERLEY